MTPSKVRKVNVIPVTKIKKEKLSDDEEDPVLCRICSKGFASEMACQNHAKVEHFHEFVLKGQDVCVRQVVKQKSRKFTEEEMLEIKLKTEEMISSMEPADLTSLASNDVEYIIIRSDEAPEPKKAKKQVEKVKTVKMIKGSVRKEKEAKPITSEESSEPEDEQQAGTAKTIKMFKGSVRKEKEFKPITGPFECMQPSTMAPEGLCHQIFLSCCEYSAHYRDEHTRRRKGLRCQVCEKPLVGEDQPYTCQVCGTVFQSNKELQEHSQTAHIKLKPFQCGVCQKRFTQQGGLQQHTRMHTGDRPYPCTFCPKAFTQKSGLEQHLRIHTKVRPYRCVICSKSFCQSIHLQQHMRTHTNVAPFQCGICQKRFKQSSHLNYHLKNHNPANLTDEQKIKYAELVRMMGKSEVLEVEIAQNPTVFVECDQIPEPAAMLDSDQVPEPREMYVISEDGSAALWCADNDS